MVEEFQDPYAASNESGIRLSEIEEKQRILKDRILLIGENLISTKEDLIKLESENKRQIKQLMTENEYIKRLLARIVNEISGYAKKSELEILERQMKMFEPLELARISDIKTIVEEELAKKNIKNK